MNRMKRNIPGTIILDYLYISIGLFLMIVLLEPFGTRDFISSNSTPYLFYVVEGISFFCIFMISELIATFCVGVPVDYSQPLDYQCRRLAALAIPCVLLNALFDGLFFCVLNWGWSRLYYYWTLKDGTFTLRWFFRDLRQSLSVGIFISAYYAFITHCRMQKYQISELTSLNTLLEAEQKRISERKDEKILLHGDSKDTLILNPMDILYLESVGNYLDIVYLEQDQTVRKRIRCSLKDAETTLLTCPSIVHVHRAFLVNINYITQISGNAAGYKLELFGCDKVLPVSKANIATFRDKIKSLSL